VVDIYTTAHMHVYTNTHKYIEQSPVLTSKKLTKGRAVGEVKLSPNPQMSQLNAA